MNKCSISLRQTRVQGKRQPFSKGVKVPLRNGTKGYSRRAEWYLNLLTALLAGNKINL